MLISQSLSDLGSDEYEPFEDLGNPTFDPDWRIVDGVLELQNYAPSAAIDKLDVELDEKAVGPVSFTAVLATFWQTLQGLAAKA